MKRYILSAQNQIVIAGLYIKQQPFQPDFEIFACEDFDGSKVAEYDAIAFGCPAMGDEVLEDTEFEPMFDGCKDALKGKNIALFGSYGWGDGEWMRNWEESCKEAGANLVCDSVICQEEPDDEATDACKALGAALV